MREERREGGREGEEGREREMGGMDGWIEEGREREDGRGCNGS